MIQVILVEKIQKSLRIGRVTVFSWLVFPRASHQDIENTAHSASNFVQVIQKKLKN